MLLRSSAGLAVVVELSVGGVSVVTEGKGSHLSPPTGFLVVSSPAPPASGIFAPSSAESCVSPGLTAGAACDSGRCPDPCGPTAGAAPSPV